MQEVTSYLKSQGVHEAYIFGSRSRNGEGDWDFGVYFDRALEGLEAHARLAAMELELKAIQGTPVDRIDLEQAHLTLLYEIVWKGQCLFTNDEDARVTKELEVRRRFVDYRQIQSFYTRALKERLNNAS